MPKFGVVSPFRHQEFPLVLKDLRLSEVCVPGSPPPSLDWGRHCFYNLAVSRLRARVISSEGEGNLIFISSIWWRGPPDISPVTFDHDDLFELPHSGRRVAYSVTRSLRCMTTVEIWHSRMGFPALPLQSAAAELVVVNLVAQHDPQANTQFVRRRNSRLAHPFLDKLATIEAFHLRKFCERKKCGVPLATVEVGGDGNLGTAGWSALHHMPPDSHKFRNELYEYCEKTKCLQRPALTAE